MAIVHINKENYEKEVMEGKILLDFWADWCGPCKMQGQILEEVSEKMPQFKIGKIDTSSEEELAERFEITAIPTLVLMENGKVLKREEGLKAGQELIEWIK